MTLTDYQTNIDIAKTVIEKLLKDSGYLEYGDASLLEYNKEDPEEAYRAEEANHILYRLDEVHRQLEYLALPVRYSGQLHLQENGRYKLGEYELTSGSSVEVLLYEEWEEVYKWVASRIEHNGESYYLVGHTDTALEGLKARKRG